MTTIQLLKANQIDKQMRNLRNALNCFEWEPFLGTPSEPPTSKRPIIIIEHDDYDCCREQTRIELELSNELIYFIKAKINEKLIALQEEFDKI